MPNVPKPKFSEMSLTEMSELCKVANSEKVLDAFGFYEEYGGSGDPVEAFNTINEIEGCLFRALITAVEPARAELKSTLSAIQRRPEKYIDAPSGVLWLLARHYCRSDEPPGTHWPDLYGAAPNGHPGGPARTPNDESIRRAAAAALAGLGGSASRPRSEAQVQLAQTLGGIFLRFNKNFGRIAEKDGETYPERGRFAFFLDLVLPRLDEALAAQGISPINRDQVVRLASDSFNARKTPASASEGGRLQITLNFP
jgi:hypothetical protein